MPLTVNQALDEFIQRFIRFSKTHPEVTTMEYDADWPSVCYRTGTDETSGNLISWEPVLRDQITDFSELSAALELTLHPDVAMFYTRYWSDNIFAQHPSGPLQILQAWNEDDLSRLQQNIIGHILMKRRLRQPETIFIALTDQEDFILSVDNQTGAVMLEQVGLQPKEQVSSNLATFLSEIEPTLPHF
ncbi:SecY-interacting protein [Paraglaciecola sp. L1A13]|uniref:SecY-interacting protein n=1 Tax=Paraglaciecola sp. L1A13 TaxID=2686359 RepID=UPI00131CDE29|nr:SecY-interacting protein [Paraglaciecola sp. L1A13]